ncbi:MAG: LemA family protein [Nitrospirae bacterium]|nr:LemA family protein [Nitrospirota bacterium]
MKKAGIILIALALLFILFGGWLFGYYNSFVNMDEGIKNAWAQVENQLQRRSDLIPNLVNTVKGYAKHEKEIFENIASARAKLAGAQSIGDKITAANEMTSALGRLLLIVERYPNLKADQSFSKLMDELAGTENRIAVERKRYNDKVMEYNQMRRRFPSNIIASMFNFAEAAYFKAPESAKEATKVDFGVK